MPEAMEENLATPFLRWAGGKRWLIKHLPEIIGSRTYNNYHELFLGGGALFFALNPCGRIYLSDINNDLIETYNAVKNHPHAIIKLLTTYQNEEAFYYEMRKTHFNTAIERAARFIYLNQTSYNGLYRVNRQGEYNVPYGFRSNMAIETDNIILVSERLRKARIVCADFVNRKRCIHAGDLVFLDPPYTVSHNNNGFIEYNQHLFSLRDQKRLSRLIDYIKRQGAYYVLTNAAHQTIHDIFNKNDRLLQLDRASLIGGDGAERGRVTEYIFTNL